MQITETLRIKRYDDRNVVLEQLTEGVNPKTREVSSKWKNIGYFPNVRMGLQRVIDLDMLVDLDEIETLRGYLMAFKKELEIVERSVDRVKV